MIYTLILIIVFAPLLGALIAGFFGKVIGRTATHRAAITLVFLAFIGALIIAKPVSDRWSHLQYGFIPLDCRHPLSI